MQVKSGKFSYLNIYGCEASAQKEFVKRECYIFKTLTEKSEVCLEHLKSQEL